MKFKYLLYLFVLLGIFFWGLGHYLHKKNQKLVDQGTIVDGVVIQLRKIRGDGAWTYQPVVKFRDHSGVERTLVADFSTNPPKYFVGEKVRVVYDANDPKYPVTARIYDEFSLWGGAIFLYGFGAFFVALAGFMWFLFSRGGAIYFGKDPYSVDGNEF